MGVGCRPSVTAVTAAGGCSGYGRDNSAGVHLSDAPIARIRDEEIAGPVNRHPEGIEKLGAGGYSRVAPDPPAPVPATVAILPGAISTPSKLMELACMFTARMR